MVYGLTSELDTSTSEYPYSPGLVYFSLYPVKVVTLYPLTLFLVWQFLCDTKNAKATCQPKQL